MGFHSFLQAQNVPWESVIAKVWNKRMFRHIRAQADAASQVLAEERGRVPGCGGIRRHGAVLATRCRSRRPRRFRSSRAMRRRGSSRSRRTCSCRRRCRAVLRCATGICRSCWRRRGWIPMRCGRRSPLTQGQRAASGFSDEHEKAVYKTAFELDQRWIIEHAADRAPFICQSQSVNVFLPANVHKRDLHQIHFMAWKRGVKSLDYCRSLSIARADNVSEKAVAPVAFTGVMGGCRRMTGRGRCRWWRLRGSGEWDELRGVFGLSVVYRWPFRPVAKSSQDFGPP